MALSIPMNYFTMSWKTFAQSYERLLAFKSEASKKEHNIRISGHPEGKYRPTENISIEPAAEDSIESQPVFYSKATQPTSIFSVYICSNTT